MGGRILVVDAGEEGRALLRALLTRLGHDAIVVEDLRAALDVVDPHASIDLVLIDVDSVGDWREAAGRLRARAEPDGVAVVALASLVTNDVRKLLGAAGIDGYVEKPLSPRALASVLDAHLPAEKRSVLPPR